MGELQAEWLRLYSRARGQGIRAAPQDEAADLLGALLLFADWQGIARAAAFRRKMGQASG